MNTTTPNIEGNKKWQSAYFITSHTKFIGWKQNLYHYYQQWRKKERKKEKKKKKREKKKRKTLTPRRNKCKLVTFLKSPECESQPKVAVRFEAECSDEFFITPNVVESNGLSSEFIIKTSKHT